MPGEGRKFSTVVFVFFFSDRRLLSDIIGVRDFVG